MAPVLLRFLGDLGELLPPGSGPEVAHDLLAPRSVKDLVEALGVPHTEVGAILLNGAPADFAHAVSAGDVIDVFDAIDAARAPAGTGAGSGPLRPEPPRPLCFVVDGHLGKLASYLRLLGFDTLWASDPSDPQLAEVSASQGRVLLTRDRGLLKRTEVVHGALVRSREPRLQLVQVVARFGLTEAARPFTRCLRCNTPLEAIRKEDVPGRIPPLAREAYDEFFRCPGCDRVYWKGTHWTRMQGLLKEVLG